MQTGIIIKVNKTVRQTLNRGGVPRSLPQVGETFKAGKRAVIVRCIKVTPQLQCDEALVVGTRIS